MNAFSPVDRTREIVRFNVGGKVHEISRSLQEQHPDSMLGLATSDSCSTARKGHRNPEFINDNDCDDGIGNEINGVDEGRDDEEKKNIDNRGENCGALFIECDGGRFQSCLDYMMNGRIDSLPPCITKDALLQDLAYYGFHNIDPFTIFSKKSLSSPKAAFDPVEKLINELADDPNQRKHLELARYCLRSFKNDASLQIKFIGSSDGIVNLRSTAYNLNRSYKDLLQFNAILERTGLKFKKCEKHYLQLDYV